MSTRGPSPVDPRRYHDSVDDILSPIATNDPVCLYLETTNRCNLLCTTCPRTYEALEPEADMSWELFERIVDQVPNIFPYEQFAVFAHQEYVKPVFADRSKAIPVQGAHWNFRLWEVDMAAKKALGR